MRRTLYAVAMSAALVAGAHAWTVTIINSSGVLNPGAVTTLVPAVVLANPLPQVTFLTAAGNPNPILVGDGTSFTNGTFSATYSIAPHPGDPNLTGFNFVIAAFIQGNAQILWQKKVVRNSDNAILYDDAGTINSSGSYVIPVTLAAACQRCDGLRELRSVHYGQCAGHRYRLAAAGGAGLGA
jgi:hypothetical protein